MSVELTDREHQIIQQLILDRWNPHRINKKIANHHGLTINQVKYMRSKPAFKAEHDKQLAIYLDSFDDIQLADRKERRAIGHWPSARCSKACSTVPASRGRSPRSPSLEQIEMLFSRSSP